MSGDVEAYTAAVAALNLAGIRWRVEVRPRRRTLGATVEPDGAVIFTVPPAATPQQVASFVARVHVRLAGVVAKQERIAPAYRVKDLADGEGFPWLGASQRLYIVDDPNRMCCPACEQPKTRHPGAVIVAERSCPGPLGKWRGRQLTVRRDAVSADTIIGWYREQGAAWASEEAERWLVRLGVRRPLGITVRDLGRHRWGIYGQRRHEVVLHWPLFQLDRRLVEYVLVHELAHAAQPGGPAHGARWQRLMDGALSDWRDREQAMVEPGRHIWVGEVSPTVPAGDPWSRFLKGVAKRS